MSEIKLKPCPFCGGEAELNCDSRFDDWFIRCNKCACKTRTFKTERSAILTWNNRKPMERIIERLESASWNTQSTFDHDGYCNDDSDCVVSLYDAIKIIEEEGGLND